MAFCSNCGTQYQDGTHFCPKCGTAAVSQAMAPPVYTTPPQPAPYGGYAPPPQAPYPNYTPPPQPVPYNNMQAQQRYGSKSKSTAVILAIFLSFFTWLYTIKRDGAKFWIGLILYLLCVITLVGGVWLGEIQLIILPAIWLWAVISTLMRNSEWYAQY